MTKTEVALEQARVSQTRAIVSAIEAHAIATTTREAISMASDKGAEEVDRLFTDVYAHVDDMERATNLACSFSDADNEARVLRRCGDPVGSKVVFGGETDPEWHEGTSSNDD